MNYAFARLPIVGLFIAGQVACLVPSRVGALILVKEGGAPLPIVAEPGHETAARDLATYLSRMSGTGFSVRVSAEKPPAPAILVGAFGRADGSTLTGDGFRWDVTPETLQISGLTTAGVRFGVFGFLEEQLGCRWWSWDEEDVPRQATILLAETQAVRNAVFTQTILMNQEAQTARNAFDCKSRVKNTEAWSGSHTIYPLLTPYASTHPDIYPLSKKTGKRGPNKLHFCYSAPGIAEALADALAGEVKKHNGNVRDVIYMAGMGDWYGGSCECDRCQAIYLEEGWTATNGVRRGIIGGTNLRMINKTAEILDSRFPGIKVGTMAYMSMEAPPTLTQPRSNVYIRIPHLRHCIIHALTPCPQNAGCFANVRKWCQLAPNRVHIWDYGVNFGENFLYPFPVISSISSNIQIYARLGIAGMIVQGNYVSTGGDLAVLKNYVWRKTLWDPGRDTAGLIREFCDGYYGPAARPVYDYVMELENAVTLAAQPEVHMDEFAKRGDMGKTYLTPERMPRLRALLQEAREKAAGVDPFARRVEEVAVSLEAFAIWRPGPLEELDGKLVRTDLGKQYTFDRAQNLLLHSRNASAKEWGPYPNYHRQLLTLHGGPLAVLKQGDLEVVAVPNLGMRIRQIRFRGKPLLRVPSEIKEKGWPQLGGAYENAFAGWSTGAVSGVAQSTQVVMRTNAGSGTSIKQSAAKTVTLEGNGVIRITVASQRVTRDEDFQNTRAALGMEYLAGRNPAQYRVEAKTATNGWVVLLPASTATPPPPAPAGGKPGKPAKAVFVEVPVPPGASALLVTLRATGCQVEETFVAPAIKGGTVSFDPATGVLRTLVNTASAGLDLKEPRQWLDRRLTVRALGEATVEGIPQ